MKLCEIHVTEVARQRILQGIVLLLDEYAMVDQQIMTRFQFIYSLEVSFATCLWPKHEFIPEFVVI